MNERVSGYFVREAGEYLDQLDDLLGGADEPNPSHLLRLARGVRGSAQMAGAETLAGVAGRLEDAVRSVTSNNIVWSAEIRHLARQTVGDLKVLLRALNRWGPEEESRVRQAIERWDDLDAVEGGAEPTEVVPIAALFYEDAGPHVLAALSPAAVAEPEPAGAGPVPIESLLLHGERALEEALALRARVEALVGAGEAAAPRLAELLEELFDLVELGRSAASAAR